jgi:virginiamycin B lyase
METRRAASGMLLASFSRGDLTMRRAGILLALALFSSTSVGAAELKVVIREWDVPTPDSRPHDPEVAPDGALWYTGQLANKLGRLDVKTGAIKEFPVKTPGSGPHGLAADAAGNIWFTANSRGYIGKLDPKTGEVAEYPMPDSRVRDPHSLAFDRNGMIFFTAQQSNFVGRLDPKSGNVTVKEVPTPHALPYGIVTGPDGAAYFCEFGSNKIGRIHPETVEVTEYTLPEGARPRRLANNPDRSIYYSDFARGYIGRLDPKSGKVEEWASPGGARSQPYGIASTSDGMVWYSESGVKPNTLVAFNSKTKSFQTWPIPSGGGVVRNMVATPDGKLYLACSGVNKVAVAQVTR